MVQVVSDFELFKLKFIVYNVELISYNRHHSTRNGKNLSNLWETLLKPNQNRIYFIYRLSTILKHKNDCRKQRTNIEVCLQQPIVFVFLIIFLLFHINKIVIFAEKRAKVQKELNDIEENFKFDMKFATDDNNDDELLKNDEQNDLEQPMDRNDEKDDDLNIKHDDTISDSNKLEINVSETSSPTKSKNTHHHHKHHHHHSHNHNHHNDKIPEDEDIITKSEFNDTKEIENDENISFDEIKMEDISMDQNQSFEPMYE